MLLEMALCQVSNETDGSKWSQTPTLDFFHQSFCFPSPTGIERNCFESPARIWHLVGMLRSFGLGLMPFETRVWFYCVIKFPSVLDWWRAIFAHFSYAWSQLNEKVTPNNPVSHCLLFLHGSPENKQEQRNLFKLSLVPSVPHFSYCFKIAQPAASWKTSHALPG